MNTDNFFDRIPQWLKSLHEMENELRNAAHVWAKVWIIGTSQRLRDISRGER